MVPKYNIQKINHTKIIIITRKIGRKIDKTISKNDPMKA
jgi:hypothetical protein